MPTGLKPGWKTSEAAITVLTIVGLTVASIAGTLPPKWAAVATSVSAAAYAIARGLAKLNPPKDATPTPPPGQ